jgi:hypothetical protein
MELDDHRTSLAGPELVLDSTVAAEGERRTPPVPVSRTLGIERHLILGFEPETLEVDRHHLNDARSQELDARPSATRVSTAHQIRRFSSGPFGIGDMSPGGAAVVVEVEAVGVGVICPLPGMAERLVTCRAVRVVRRDPARRTANRMVLAPRFVRVVCMKVLGSV